MMRRLAVLLLLLSSSLACTLPRGQDTIIVTATPSIEPATSLPPATDTPIPPPTVAPTATLEAPLLIVQADNALRNGDFDSAVEIYQSILSQPVLSVDPKLRADAMFGYGTAALREGLFSTAVQALTEFIASYPGDVRAGQALFLRGDSFLGLSAWESAIKDFEDYLKNRPGLIDSYAYERIGDAYLALDQPTLAQENYAKAVQGTSRALVPLLALKERVATAYLNAGNAQAAFDQYEEILQVAQVPAYRASIGVLAADVLAGMGNVAAANQRYQQVFDQYPQTVGGYRAMRALLQAGVKIDDLQRGRVSFAAEDYNDAITALYNYTSNTPLTQIDPAAFLLLGQAYRAAGNSSAAVSSFQTIINQYPTSPLYGQAWLEEGRTMFLSGQVSEAIQKYKQLATDHPDVPESAEALWRAGYLYATQGDSENSLATFEILGTNYKGSEWATDGLFRGGMAAYNAQAYARAQRLFSLLATNGTGELQAAGYLWLGRLYQLNNQTDLARTAYGEAAKIDPGGYYSLRAADLFNGQGPFVPPAKIDWDYNSPARIAEAEAWMRQTFNITQQGDLWRLSTDLENDPRMIRGNELFAVAAYEEAITEFTALIDANQLNPLALYQLATYFSRIGLYREAINASAKMLDGAKIRTEDAPRYIASLRFPIGYADLVLPETQEYGVDPLLVFSLIRQESLFEGLATSYAQAQGLMQIIPDTGAYIAAKLGWTDFTNSDLYRPHVNVTFGIYYLYEQLQTFDGNVYAALAAYNGGPGNSAQWLQISNGDPDMFLQAITFEETRTYVRRIYEQYASYRAIYGVKQ
ncbi:MAG: tetratricopeptide repeat protein [Anaerolineae bacterium]|nr:tetratricopeptide repeat protein [Anaerolineae bacterium]